MQKITKEFYIYNFNELDEKTKEKVIWQYIDEWINSIDYDKLNKNTNLYKAIKKAEDLQTPWFSYKYVYDYNKAFILKQLKKHKYYKDGDLYE